jgi:hypothetical protein
MSTLFKIILGAALFAAGMGFRKGYRNSLTKENKLKPLVLLYAGWLFIIMGILIVYNALL